MLFTCFSTVTKTTIHFATSGKLSLVKNFYRNKAIKILWQTVKKRTVKSFTYSRTVHVIWFSFPLRFQSRHETAFQNLVAHSFRPQYKPTIANSRFDNLGDWLVFRFRAFFFQLLFFCYVVNRLTSSRELQCHFSNTWQNHIWKWNQESIAAMCYH